jgi:hypothetical protein
VAAWLRLQQAQVAVNQLAAAHYKNIRVALEHFAVFLGAGADVNVIEAGKLQSWYQHAWRGSLPGGRTQAGGSKVYTKEVFTITRTWLAGQLRGDCLSPRTCFQPYPW